MESGDSEDSSKWNLHLDLAESETRTVGFHQHSDADVVVITPVGEMRPVKRWSSHPMKFFFVFNYL